MRLRMFLLLITFLKASHSFRNRLLVICKNAYLVATMIMTSVSSPFSCCSGIVRLNLMCFFFQAGDGIRDLYVTGVQTCALPICSGVTMCWSMSFAGRRLRWLGSPRSGVLSVVCGLRDHLGRGYLFTC